MKIRLAVALLGLAFGFAVPAFAQQKDAVDPQVADQLSALSKKTDEAFNSGDAVALGALYTEDAVLVNDTGPIYGREAIENIGRMCSSRFNSATISTSAIRIHLIL